MTGSSNADADNTHIDIGGIALPRKTLAEVLPDLDRFERHLPDALAVDADMKAGDGSIPDYVAQWPQPRIEAVVATLKELGSLREQASAQLGKGGEGAGRGH